MDYGGRLVAAVRRSACVVPVSGVHVSAVGGAVGKAARCGYVCARIRRRDSARSASGLIMPNMKFSKSAEIYLRADDNPKKHGFVFGISKEKARGQNGRGAVPDSAGRPPCVRRGVRRGGGRSAAGCGGLWGLVNVPAGCWRSKGCEMGGIVAAMLRLVSAAMSKPGVIFSLGGLAEYARTHGVFDAIQEWVVAEAAERAGLELDSVAPLSDASFCNALYRKTGIQLRTLKDRESVEEDLQRFAIDQIAQRTGFQMTVTNFRDVEGLKLDLVNIGLFVVQQRTGIPIAAVSGTPAEWATQIKGQLLTYAEAELRQKLAADAQNIAAKMGELVDLDALARSEE